MSPRLRLCIGLSVMAGVFLFFAVVTKSTAAGLINLCIVLVFMPPRFDPAIIIKERLEGNSRG